jgi:Mg/Co/Ni transporter MgtE
MIGRSYISKTSKVLAVRALALNRSVSSKKELVTAVGLACVLSFATIFRVAVIQSRGIETAVALAAAMFCIVFVAVIFGTCLPTTMLYFGIDPAHSSAAIQVFYTSK